MSGYNIKLVHIVPSMMINYLGNDILAATCALVVDFHFWLCPNLQHSYPAYWASGSYVVLCESMEIMVFSWPLVIVKVAIKNA